jgi:hypothetical protein
MPLTYTIDSDAGLLSIVGEGALTQSERVRLVLEALQDPAFRPGLATLFDISQTTTTPSMSQLREIVMLLRQHAHRIGQTKIAVVAHMPIVFGMAREFQTLIELETSLMEISVFSERDEALKWLGKSAPA